MSLAAEPLGIDFGGDGVESRSSVPIYQLKRSRKLTCKNIVLIDPRHKLHTRVIEIDGVVFVEFPDKRAWAGGFIFGAPRIRCQLLIVLQFFFELFF